MAHLVPVYELLPPVPQERPKTPLRWLGLAVVVGYMAFSSMLTEWDLQHQTHIPGPFETALAIAIWVLACVAPLLIPGVSRNRRLVALAIFAGMWALMYLPRFLHLPPTWYSSYWSAPVLYAAGWIVMRHTSRWSLVAVAVVPIMTALLGPLSPLRGGTGQLGGIKPFDLFIALDLFATDVVPVVAAVLVAGAIAQEVPAPDPGHEALRRWPYWLAVVAIVAALVGVVFVAMPSFLPLLAIVLGHVAARAVRRKGLGGRSLAITAFILGYAEVLAFLWLLYQALANFKIEF